MIVRSLALCAAILLLSACQVGDGEGPLSIQPTDPTVEAAPALGSPERDWPRTLDQLLAFAAPEALTWQDEPVLADLTVWLDIEDPGPVTWARARLTYVAPGAERMLTYRSRPGELRIERPRLAGLQLPELPRAAVEAIPPLPEGVLEPVDLAAASARALADCEAGSSPVEAVLYATGAPAAWDGTQWTRIPTWRATVVTAGVGVSVDPTTGQAFAPLTCVEPFLLTID
ncbi:hypothetical protein BH23ACT9_BH23ACT9_11440 [soil metagenome]